MDDSDDQSCRSGKTVYTRNTTESDCSVSSDNEDVTDDFPKAHPNRRQIDSIYPNLKLSPNISLDDLGNSPDLNRRRPSAFSAFNIPEGSPTANSLRYETRLQRLNTRLLVAVENGDAQRITRLLRLNADPNATCQLNHVSACHLAALKNNDSLAMLIKAGADTFRTDLCGRTPLHFAAWSGNCRQIELLLNFTQDTQPKSFLGFRIDTTRGNVVNEQINAACNIDSDFTLPKDWKDSVDHHCSLTKDNLPAIQPAWTALHAACARAHFPCVKCLIAAGADTNALDFLGRTPLDIVGDAYYSGYTIDVHMFNETIKLLAAAGGGMNITRIKGCNKINTPLHTAVELESKEAINVLLTEGASVTYLNSQGLTPMHICVKKQNSEFLQLLLNFEAKVNVLAVDTRDIDGLTVLNAAVRTKWMQGVRIALGARASVFRKANDGDAAFHSAAAMGYIEFLRGIIATNKAKIDLQNEKGQTALFIAIINDQLDVVKLLMENGAAAKICQPSRINALHIAAKHGRPDILEYFLTYDGYDDVISCLVNETSEADNFTPLAYAVSNNQPECVGLLLWKDAIIDFLVPGKENIMTTPLHIAAEKNYYDVAKKLLDYDSRIVNSRNSLDVLPLHEACIFSNREIIALLIQKGADLVTKHAVLKTPLEILMVNLSKPVEFLEKIFDTCISSQYRNMRDTETIVAMNYEILLPRNTSNGKRMRVVETLVNTGNTYGQRKLLHHPVVESFLYLEWQALLPFFYATLTLYMAFVLSLNVYVVSVIYYQDVNRNNSMTNKTFLYEPVPDYLYSDIWKYMLYVTVTLLAFKELFVIKMKTRRYFLFLETWVKFGAIGLSMFLPSVVSWRKMEKSQDMKNSILNGEAARLTATVAVLLSWLEMMFLLSRLPRWGYYVLMFGKVATKVIKVLLTFGFLIIGFSLCFMIQFRAKPPFEGPWASITKTLVMMTSEYDYMSTINREFAMDIDASIAILRVIFVTFVVLASIVLMNLMVGIAVNDVNSLEDIGNQKRLQKQVETLTSMESLIYNETLAKVLPRVFYLTQAMRKNVHNDIELNSRQTSCVFSKMLPKHIKEAIFEKAMLQKKHMDEENGTKTYHVKLNEIQNSIEKITHDLEVMKNILLKRP
ncbi:transient receptor potential cation channel subfamily A member 1-like [Anticarsia gemmatalis]|uniref:transient receptor potential cation channel subfamily A member 1-like n=1 Tax=Anticarsia gemmatalis TaxID=129554 RepID=UPI003F76030A